MIALVEGAKRQRTPNEIALAILLAGLTIIFLMAVVTLRPFGLYAGDDRRHGRPRRPARVPDPDDDRRPAVGHRHRRDGPRRPVQRPGHERPRGRGVRRRRRHPARQDRHDHLRQPAGGVDHARRPGVTEAEAVAAALSRLDPRRDARGSLDRRARPRSVSPSSARRPAPATTRASRRSTRRSPRRSRSAPRPARAASTTGRRRRRSSRARSTRSSKTARRRCPPTSSADSRPDRRPGRDAARPRAATAGCSASIELKDTVKEGLVERFAEFRRMGIRTVMITGDNPRTAATIAREAGVDDFIAQAKPEEKIALHPQGAGRRPPRGDDRRRHERRAGARPVRRRPGHEQRDVGGQGGGQHGRPRLRPDQAARGHRDRQAAADHPRLDHDVLDRQRRGEVLRDRPGDVRERSTRSSTRSTSWACRRRRARSCRRSSSTP